MALIQTSFDRFFLRIAQALQPYRGHVVFIGGCANVLYPQPCQLCYAESAHSVEARIACQARQRLLLYL